MTQPTRETEPEPPRTVRDFKKDKQESRRRGARRGLLARYALRNLPPVEEDEP